MENFDIQDWYNGNLNLKSLNIAQAKKYYQYRLRDVEVDTNNYQFYSIQKDDDKLKIITIVYGATGNFQDLRMLIYDEKDSLIGFHSMDGIGTDTDLNLKYKVTSARINDTTYLSTKVKEYIGEFDLGKVRRESYVTEFIIELGHMKESKTSSKQKYTLE